MKQRKRRKRPAHEIPPDPAAVADAHPAMMPLNFNEHAFTFEMPYMNLDLSILDMIRHEGAIDVSFERVESAAPIAVLRGELLAFAPIEAQRLVVTPRRGDGEERSHAERAEREE